MSQTNQEGLSQNLSCNLLVEKQPPGPGPAKAPTPPKCVDSFTLSERRGRKSLQTKYRAAACKTYANAISLKSENQRTHEERDMMDLIETRRLRKNQRSRQRMKEEQTEVDRIFEKHEQDRTFEESAYMDKIRRRTARKNEGDRLRRLRQRLGDRDDLKLEPLIPLKRRGTTGSIAAAKLGKRCVDPMNDTEVTMHNERSRTAVIAAPLCHSPTRWPIVQEDFELHPLDLLQVPWRTETGDVVVPSCAPFVPQEEIHFNALIDESLTNKSACPDILLLDTNRRTTHPLHPLLLMQPAFVPMLNNGEQCTSSNPGSILFNSVNDPAHSSNGVYSSAGGDPASLVGAQSLSWCSPGHQVQYQNLLDTHDQHQAVATPLQHFNSPALWETTTACAAVQHMNNCMTHRLPSQTNNPALLQPSIRCFIGDTNPKPTGEASSWSDGHIVRPGPWETTQCNEEYSCL